LAGGCGEALRVVFYDGDCEATARGSDPVVLPCRMVHGVAMALRRWVLHDGGFLWCGAICFSRFAISAGPYLTAAIWVEKVVSRGG
jgi:hypothetical protein